MNKAATITALVVLSGLGWLASLKSKFTPTPQKATATIPEMVDKTLAASRHVGTGGTAVLSIKLFAEYPTNITQPIFTTIEGTTNFINWYIRTQSFGRLFTITNLLAREFFRAKSAW